MTHSVGKTSQYFSRPQSILSLSQVWADFLEPGQNEMPAFCILYVEKMFMFLIEKVVLFRNGFFSTVL